MKVTVKLHTTLKKYAPAGAEGGTAVLEVADGATVRSLAAQLGIPEGFVGAVFLGSQRAELDSTVAPGIEVNLLAPIGGG